MSPRRIAEHFLGRSAREAELERLRVAFPHDGAKIGQELLRAMFDELVLIPGE